MKPFLSIIMPVYNEAGNIVTALDRIKREVRGIPYEVDVVYDDDSDSTVPAIVSVRKNYPFSIRLIKNKHGRGVLSAIKTGFDEAKGEFLLFTTADLSDNPADIVRMYELMEQGYDLVCGSRYMRGGACKSRAPFKKLMSQFIGVSLHYLTGINTLDVTNNFKMYSRKSLLKGIKIESDGGFELATEITVKAFAAGKKITEVPTVWRDRVSGKSRFKFFGWAPKYFRWYVYALAHRPKKATS